MRLISHVPAWTHARAAVAALAIVASLTFMVACVLLTAGKSYPVRLHFAETYGSGAGQRSFNITINGRRVLTRFDIVVAAGAVDKAVVEQFTVAADHREDHDRFTTTVRGNAEVDGIEVVS